MFQVGLLKEKTPDGGELGSSSERLHKGPAHLHLKDASGSPFREIMQTLEKPPPFNIDFNSPPKSADYVKTKTSFFQVKQNPL